MKGFRADINRTVHIAEAKAYALKLLSYRSRSRKEMREKLRRKGFNNEQINSTIEFLENSGLISDEALASELFRHSLERKSLGKKGIEMFLSIRGIDKRLINKTLSTYTTETEVKAARKFVKRKLKTLENYPENVVKRKLWGMLQRRGFATEVINKAVNSIKP